MNASMHFDGEVGPPVADPCWIGNETRASGQQSDR
jgi:hypothetical protein